MYIYEKKKTDKNGNKVSYLQLCVSYKDNNGKPKRKMILHLGKKGDMKLKEKMKKLASQINELAGIKDVIDIDRDISSLWAKNIGPKLIFRKLWHDLKLNEILGRFIVCHNPKQAEEDAIKREYFKRIIQNKVLHSTDKSWIVKNGYKKYIKLKEDIIESVDYDKLEKEKIYDGKWILLTNTELSYEEVAKYYKSLWQIENAFKELKSSLDVKPMYHWVERRIKAHVFICFLALVLELGFKNKLGETISYTNIMNNLKQLQANAIKVVNNEVIKRTQALN